MAFRGLTGILGSHMHHTPPHFENLILTQKGWVHILGKDASTATDSSYIYIYLQAIYMGKKVFISDRSAALPAVLPGEPPGQWQFPATD